MQVGQFIIRGFLGLAVLVMLTVLARVGVVPSGGELGTAEAAVCNETGTIAADTHWTSSCVHVVDGLTISVGVTLTIGPGTVVKPVNTIGVQGAIVAQGTAEQPITFTSFRDDSAGGDTNGDGSASSAAPGDWDFIHLFSGTSASGASAAFDHVLVKFGGRPPSCTGPCPSANGVITNTVSIPFGVPPARDPAASLTFANSTISDSANTAISMSTEATVSIANSSIRSTQGTGLSVGGVTQVPQLSVTGSTFTGNRIGAWLSGNPSSVITGNAFADNTGDGLHIWGDTVPSHNVFTNNQGYAIVADQPFWTQRSTGLFEGNAGSDNRFNAILLDLVNEPTVSTETNTLAANPTLPYVFDSLTISRGATLTLDPGTVLKVGSGGNQPTITVQGALVSHGTASDPIIITSKKDDAADGDSNGDGSASAPLAGDWSFVFLNSGDANVGASASFDHTTVRYGGNPVSGCVGPCPVPLGVITNIVSIPFGVPPSTDPHASLSFRHGTISDVANTGIEIYGASAAATISDSRLLSNGPVIVAAGAGSFVDARNNWWGDSSGPTPADSSCSAASGSGSKVGCGVLFDPWLTSDPSLAPPPDSDGDGVPDASDSCPGTPPGATVDANGCSQGQVDQDLDGVCDPGKASSFCAGTDACPAEPEDFDGFQDDDGCPDPDNDGDGIPDGEDKCPGTPTGGIVDVEGCSATQNEQRLANKFSPVLWMASDDYQPEEVQIVLDEPSRPNCSTELRYHRSIRRDTLLADCPTVSVLANFADVTKNYINIKGMRVGEEDRYWQQYSSLSAAYDLVTYADITLGGGRVVIDYWLFYYYDDFFIFDHEGDWERIRVIFRAATVQEALAEEPTAARYSVHICDSTGTLTPDFPARPWAEIEKIGTHPVAYVARGSHANYFDDGVLGFHSLLPCSIEDHTFKDVLLTPTVIGGDCDNAAPDQAWLRFKGRWGEWPGGPKGPCR